MTSKPSGSKREKRLFRLDSRSMFIGRFPLTEHSKLKILLIFRTRRDHHRFQSRLPFRNLESVFVFVFVFVSQGLRWKQVTNYL